MREPTCFSQYCMVLVPNIVDAVPVRDKARANDGIFTAMDFNKARRFG
jgi:hypothetical protein